MHPHPPGKHARTSPAGARRGAGRGRRGLAAAVTALAALAAAGCAGSAPGPRQSSAPTGSGGLVSPVPGVPGGPVSAAPAVPRELAGAGQRSGVAGGALFGGNLQLVSEARRLGRNLAIVRVYYRIGEQFGRGHVKSLMAAGSTVLVSLASVPGQGPSYASIIAGHEDAAIKRFLGQVEQAAVTYHLGAIYFDFEVEANSPPHRQLGTPAQFIQAWDHVHQLAETAHLNWNQGGRLHWVLILTRVAYSPMASRPQWARKAGQASSFWPGANEVDIVGADGYNSGGCHNSGVNHYVASGSQIATPQQLFNPLVSFARAQGNLPVFIPEWGSVPYASQYEQPRFIEEMNAFVAANPEVAAALYWNSKAPGKSCDYSLGSHPLSLAALAAMGHSAALQGHVIPSSG